ncbi:MAG: riboflavin kinase [Bacilli bacterium]
MRAIVIEFKLRVWQRRIWQSKTLAKMAEENGWEYRSVGGVAQGGRRISSTRLRDAVIKGDMALYKKLSGENYTATGTTKTGKRLGRKIGFPTINLPWDPECKPPFGVYAAILECAGATYEGVANYGTSPTVGKTEPLVETHLFAKNVPFGARRRTKVRFLKLLRPQKKFSNLQQLKQQIEKDANEAKSFFAKENGKLRQSRKGAQ